MPATSDIYVIEGPPILGEVSKESVGLRIYQTLKSKINEREPAFIDVTNNIEISFQDLLETSCKLATWLRGFCKPKDTALICSENSIHFYKPVIASFFCGVIAAPINDTYNEREILHALKIAKPQVIFCSKSSFPKFYRLLKTFKRPLVKHIVILEALDAVLKDVEVDINNFGITKLESCDQTAAILYSSGTTGLSKGVMLSHSNINHRYNLYCDSRISNIQFERTIVIVPFYHAYGFLLTLNYISSGMKVIFLERFKELDYFSAIEKYKVTYLTVVPPIMVLFAKTPSIDKFDLSSLTCIKCGAAPLSKELESAVSKRLKINDIQQAYGMTETCLAVLAFYSKDTPKSGSSGRALPGVKLQIKELETDKSLGPNSIGELWVKSKLCMKGYYGDEKATQGAFKDGWLMTGDLGYYDEDGYFYIVGRLKELIKYKGFQVAPAELEALLLTHPKIKDVAVIGIPDDLCGELPLAFVVKQPGSDLSKDEVQQFINNLVSYSKRLHGGVEFLEAIPKSTSGKILRIELRKLVKGIKSKL